MIRLADIPISRTKYSLAVEEPIRKGLVDKLSDASFTDFEERRYVSFLLRSLDDVLYGKPERLLSLVAVDESFRRSHHWIPIEEIGKRNWKGRLDAHFELHQFLAKTFSYDAFLRGVGGWGAHEFIQLLLSLNRMKCCPYCNAEYVYAIRKLNGKGKVWMNKTSLDHYLPKSKFPYLSVSLYNLIPSCTRCNSGSKTMRLPIRFIRCGRFVRAEYSDFNPYLGSFHHVAAFSLKDYNRLVMEGFGFDEEPELKMRFAPGSRGQCARQMADALHLKKVYGKIYGDEIKAIFAAGRILKTNGYVKDRVDFVNPKRSGICFDAKTLLLRCSLQEDKINLERLSKVTMDIADQMGIE